MRLNPNRHPWPWWVAMAIVGACVFGVCSLFGCAAHAAPPDIGDLRRVAHKVSRMDSPPGWGGHGRDCLWRSIAVSVELLHLGWRPRPMDVRSGPCLHRVVAVDIGAQTWLVDGQADTVFRLTGRHVWLYDMNTAGAQACVTLG